MTDQVTMTVTWFLFLCLCMFGTWEIASSNYFLEIKKGFWWFEKWRKQVKRELFNWENMETLFAFHFCLWVDKTLFSVLYSEMSHFRNKFVSFSIYHSYKFLNINNLTYTAISLPDKHKWNVCYSLSSSQVSMQYKSWLHYKIKILISVLLLYCYCDITSCHFCSAEDQCA